MEEQLFVRIDKETKETFVDLVRREGKTASEVLRQLVDEYIRERDMSAYLTRVLDRMSDRVQRQGYQQEDVERIIRETRQDEHEGGD